MKRWLIIQRFKFTILWNFLRVKWIDYSWPFIEFWYKYVVIPFEAFVLVTIAFHRYGADRGKVIIERHNRITAARTKRENIALIRKLNDLIVSLSEKTGVPQHAIRARIEL